MITDLSTARRARCARGAGLAAALVLASAMAACRAAGQPPRASGGVAASGTATVPYFAYRDLVVPQSFRPRDVAAPATLTPIRTLTPTLVATATVTPTQSITPTATLTPTVMATDSAVSDIAPAAVTETMGTAIPVAVAPRRAAGGGGSGALTGARLRIVRIGVDAAIEQTGLTSSGHMGTPRNVSNVAWYERGARWGGPGNVAIAGHLDNRDGSPSVFWNLGQLVSGDEIFIDDPAGQTIRYVVDTKIAFLANEAPLRRLFGSTTERNLNLITCHGQWDSGGGGYNQRLVVFARMADG